MIPRATSPITPRTFISRIVLIVELVLSYALAAALWIFSFLFALWSDSLFMFTVGSAILGSMFLSTIMYFWYLSFFDRCRKLYFLDPRKEDGFPVRSILDAAFSFVTLLRLAVVRLGRNAIWINITIVICSTRLLPLSARTRATTILNALFARRKLEKKSGHVKSSVEIRIGEQHRKIEESKETTLCYHYHHKAEKYWNYWNHLEYDPRYFITKEESRIVRGRWNTSEVGQYTKSMGEDTGFLLDTGDRVEMKEISGNRSTISFTTSEGDDVLIPLTCAQANNLVHWIWQHSIDTVYGALEGRDDFVIDRNVFEMDIFLFCVGIAIRIFIYHYFGIISKRVDPEGSDPVSIALLHLSILAAIYNL